MQIHFISGLPRSGSTLLAAILRQNPKFHASMTGPVAEIFAALLRSMSGVNEGAVFISNCQRQRILQSVIEAYYADLSAEKLIFDTSRAWCTFLPALKHLFPGARIICCLRNPAWILDSIERYVQAHPFEASKMFKYEPAMSVYNRVEAVMATGGVVSSGLNALRQAWFSEDADRLIAVRYESLAERPGEVMDRLYEMIGEERFAHNYDHVDYDAPEFDARLGMPGFHKVEPKVELKRRKSILPPEVFKFHDRCFWEGPGENPRAVPIL